VRAGLLHIIIWLFNIACITREWAALDEDYVRIACRPFRRCIEQLITVDVNYCIMNSGQHRYKNLSDLFRPTNTVHQFRDGLT
jgi:hypothetical protein